MTANSPYSPLADAKLMTAYDAGFLDTAPVREAEASALRGVANAVQASVAEELEALVDSADEIVSREDVISAISELARELRAVAS